MSDANFTPNLGEYKSLQPFRFWCQKVLPLVYDDSLSYYELLCKVVDYLNKTMEDVETLHGDVTNLHKAYIELQGYVNNYFNNLDVQNEINNKLDSMASDGTLLTIIAPTISSATASWLSEHITNPANPPIDTSLTVSGAAADAKITGNFVSNLSNRMFPVVKYDNWFDHTRKVTEGYFLNYQTGKATEGANYGYSEYYPIKCDTIFFAAGFGNGAQFCFYDNGFNFISGVLIESGSGIFKTPKNCSFIRYSVYLPFLSNLLTVNEGNKNLNYTPYVFLGYNSIKRLEVGKYCEYKKVSDAVNDAVNGDIIFIHNGYYPDEVIDASTKTISIIGESSNGVTIVNDLSTYSKPPLQIGSGFIYNLRLISKNTGKQSQDPDGTKSYAIHCDYDSLENSSLTIKNCELISEVNSGIGIGLRTNGVIILDNCLIQSFSERVPLFVHDSVKINAGKQYLTIKNCDIFSNVENCCRFDSEGVTGASIYLRLEHNTLSGSGESPKGVYNNVSDDVNNIHNFNNLINYYNLKNSFNNQLTDWNYSK